MANITAIDATQLVPFAAAETILTADDIITFEPTRKQLMVLRNPTAGTLTATVDGSTSTTVAVPGLGAVSVAAGIPIAVPANSVRAIQLSAISAYCQGVVHVTGGAGLAITLFNL